MWIITDDKGKVVDKASKEKSLSRGYIIAGVTDDTALAEKGYMKTEVTEKIDIRIEDYYTEKDGLVKNHKFRAGVELPGVESNIVENTLLSEKAAELGFVDQKEKYDAELSTSTTRRTELLEIIG